MTPILLFLFFSQEPHVSNNSGNNEWYTPPEFIQASVEVMGSIDWRKLTMVRERYILSDDEMIMRMRLTRPIIALLSLLFTVVITWTLFYHECKSGGAMGG